MKNKQTIKRCKKCNERTPHIFTDGFDKNGECQQCMDRQAEGELQEQNSNYYAGLGIK